MVQELHMPDLPENERKRIAQRATDLTKRKAYKECLAIGECEGPIVGSHSIPRAWLRKICDNDGKVRVFEKLPLNPFRANNDTYPVLNHLNSVSVGYFTCERHERLFSRIDDPNLDVCDSGNLNLLVYRPILETLWTQNLLMQQARAKLAEAPQNELFEKEVGLQNQRIAGLRHYKKRIEGCLDPKTCHHCEGGKCRVVGHKTFHIPGEPALAVSGFSDGIRTRANARFNYVQHLMNWGMTVLPLSNGHMVIFHHFIDEEKIIEPLGRMLSHLHGKKLQGQISYWTLKSFEQLAISPSRWEQFGRHRRSAMLDVFYNEMPDVGFGDMEQIQKWDKDFFNPNPLAANYNQLNLFNPEKR